MPAAPAEPTVYHTLVTEGVNPALAAHMQLIHNQLDGIASRQESLLRDLPEIVTKATAGTARALLADAAFVETLWKDHWAHFSKHAADGSQRWLGARLFTALGVGLAGLGTWILLRGAK